MKRWAFGLLLVAVLGSAAVAQDGVRTARLPDGRCPGRRARLRRRWINGGVAKVCLCVLLEGPESADRAGLECVAGRGTQYVGLGGRGRPSRRQTRQKRRWWIDSEPAAPMPLVLAVALAGR